MAQKQTPGAPPPTPQVHTTRVSAPSAIEDRLDELEATLARGETFEREVDDGSVVDDIEEDGDIVHVDLQAEQQAFVEGSEQPDEASLEEVPYDELEEHPGAPDPDEQPVEELDDLPEDEEEEPPAAEDEDEAVEEGTDPEAAAEEEGEEVFALEIPGAREEDDPIPLELEGLDQETREGLQRMKNGYMRREQLRVEKAAFEEERNEVREILGALRADPLGFLVDEVPDELQEGVVRSLLLGNEELFEKVLEDASKWATDPAERRAAAAEAEAERLRSRDRIRADNVARREAQQSLERVRTAVEALMPDGLTETEAAAFEDAAYQDIQRWVVKQKTNRITHADIVDVLTKTGVFRRYGLDPAVARRTLAEGPAASTTDPATPRRARASRSRSREEKAPKKTGEELKRRRARKRSAASTPRGVGGVPTRTSFKKGQGIEERARDALRQLRSQRG